MWVCINTEKGAFFCISHKGATWISKWPRLPLRFPVLVKAGRNGKIESPGSGRILRWFQLLSLLNMRNSKFKAFREALESEHVWNKRMFVIKLHCSGKLSYLGLN